MADALENQSSVCAICGGELRAGLCPPCTLHAAFQEVDEPPDEPSEVIGDYELLEIIAQGGMGVVWRARQKRLRRIVALKLLRESSLPGEDPARRFLLEAEAVAALRHPHIISVYEIGEVGGRYFLSMELMACSLADRLREAAIGPSAGVDLMVKIAHGVQHAHDRGVLHRDLKPSNILLDEAGQPRVSDFGLARFAGGNEHRTHAGAILGTPAYMSPEQAAGRHGELTMASDLYSLGAIFYELLTGVVPFESDAPLELLRRVVEDEPARPSSLVASLDRDLETICLKCLEKAPAARYPSALALAEELERWQRGEPIHARPVSVLEWMWKWSRRHKAKAALLGTLLVGFISIATLVRVFYSRLQSEVRNTHAAEHSLTLRLAAQHSTAAARLAGSGDALRALPYLVENLNLLATDPAAVRLARVRFETIVRTSPVLEQFWLPEGLLRGVDHDEEHERVAIFSGTIAQVFDSRSGAPVSPPLVHASELLHGCLMRQGMRLLCAHAGGWTLWDLSTGRPLMTQAGQLFRMDTATNALFRYAANNHCFLAWGGAAVQLFASGNGQAVGEPMDFGSKVEWALVCPDNKLYLVMTADGWLHVCDVQTRQELFAPIAVGAHGLLRGFSPKLDRIALESDAGRGLRLLEIELATGRITVEAGSSNSTHLVHGWLGTSRTWSVLKRDDLGYHLCTALNGNQRGFLSHGAQGFGGSFSSETNVFATAARNGSLRMWGSAGTPLTTMLWVGGRPEHLAVSKSGDRLLCASTEPAVRLWLRRRNSGAFFASEEGSKLAGAFFCAGRVIFCHTDGRIESRALNGEAPLLLRAPLPAAAAPITHAVADGRGHFALISGTSSELWDMEKGCRVGAPIPFPATIAMTAISAEGTQIALLSQSGLCHAGAPAHPAPIPVAAETVSVQFSPDGRTLLAVGAEHASQLWSMERRTLLATLPGGSYGGAFSPDGRSIVLWGGPQRAGAMNARVFDTATGRPKFAPVVHTANLTFAAFSPDSRLLLTSSRDDSRLWDAATGSLIRAMRENPTPAATCGFSPDGTFLWTRTSKDLSLWETATGTLLAPPMGVGGNGGVFWSPDGICLAALDEKHGLFAWDLSPGNRPISQMRALAHLLSSHRLTADGTLLPLTQAELREAKNGAGPTW